MALKLVSPWIDKYHAIQAFFAHDPEVHTIFDEDEHTVKLFVDGECKAAALGILLNKEYQFGNYVLKIEVIPANNNCPGNETGNIHEDAFDGNNAFSFARTITGIFSNPITYVVFKNAVVQYYNDDLSDAYGQRSCLYEDIAREILEPRTGVYYSTDKPVYGIATVDWP